MDQLRICMRIGDDAGTGVRGDGGLGRRQRSSGRRVAEATGNAGHARHTGRESGLRPTAVIDPSQLVITSGSTEGIRG